MSNKTKEYEDSFAKETVVEDPIEKAPAEKKVKEEEVAKRPFRIICIMRDGCIAEDIENPAFKRQVFGAEYLEMKVGDIIEL